MIFSPVWHPRCNELLVSRELTNVSPEIEPGPVRPTSTITAAYEARLVHNRTTLPTNSHANAPQYHHDRLMSQITSDGHGLAK